MMAMREKRSHFGSVLACFREERGLTQLELATRMQRDQRTVSSMEKGMREPLLSSVVLFARGLGVRAAELVERYEQELERIEKEKE